MGGTEREDFHKKAMTAKAKRRKYVSKNKRRGIEKSFPKNEVPSAGNADVSSKKKENVKNKTSKMNLDTAVAKPVDSSNVRQSKADDSAKTGLESFSFRSSMQKKQDEYPGKDNNKLSGSMSDPTCTGTESTKIYDTSTSHPFDVNETDHCETPLEAYKDIALLLEHFAKALGKTRATLRIYDPYYCNGGIKARLASLGFNNVWNKNEDFYENIEQGNIPDYDVLLTNPPYSGAHMEKLLTFAADLKDVSLETKNKKHHNRSGENASKKPFLLLLPHFVYTKDYYKKIFPNCEGGKESPGNPFYLVPQARYSYIPPKWVSEAGSTSIAKGKVFTQPFPTFWYCNGAGRMHDDLQYFLTANYGQSGVFRGFESKVLKYASCTNHIPREMRGELDTNKKRANPRARKRMLAKKRNATTR